MLRHELQGLQDNATNEVVEHPARTSSRPMRGIDGSARYYVAAANDSEAAAEDRHDGQPHEPIGKPAAGRR